MQQNVREISPENTENELGEAKISRLLLKFSLPCILSLLISALYNIIDQIFIGNSELGYLGNTAIGVVFPVTIVVQGFAWCFGDGSAAYLSLCQGKKDTKNAHKCIGTGIVVSVAVSLVLILFLSIFRRPVLRLAGASDQSIRLAEDYFFIILFFFPVFMLMNMMNSVIRADGSPAFSMLSMLSGAVVNIILDPVFIFALHWGIKGAAWATVIGQVVSFAICIFYFFKSKTFRLEPKSFLPDLRVFGNAVKLGLSTFVTQMSIAVVSLVCNFMLSRYGAASRYGADIPIAVIGIETKVFTIIINIVVGLILGGQPVLGYNYGAKKYDRVKKTYRIIFAATLAVGLLSTLVVEVFPREVVSIFGSSDDELYLEFAEKTFRIFLSLVTFTCIVKMNSIFLQAVGQPVKATVASLVRDLVCFVPLVCILPRFFGIEGILYAAPVADCIAVVVTAILILAFFRSMKKASASSPEGEAFLKPSRPGSIVTIAREHGSAGKQIGKEVAQRLGIPFYYKEMTALAAQESGLDKEFVSDINADSPVVLREAYLGSEAVRQAVAAQEKVIRRIAENGSCVIVGRAADYVLRDYRNVVRIFLYAPTEYRVKKVSEMYGDSSAEAQRQIKRSDAARAAYYRNASGLTWGDVHNYDLCLDASLGVEKTAETVCAFLNEKNK